jgi:predicted phage terminase large subunit-like protein
MVTPQQAAIELLARRRARRSLHDYITYTTADYIVSNFSKIACAELDKFIELVNAGVRPICIFDAPPQHGKSEIVSRRLPAYLFGRFPNLRIAAASYSSGLAGTMSLDVRRNLASPEHLRIFPYKSVKSKFTVNRNGEFTSPYSDTGKGGYIGDGIGGGFTGRPADIFIIDDPIKNHEEALSPVTKESVWNWYQSTQKSRMSKNSGVIVMATRWAEDDLSGRLLKKFKGNKRLIHLSFPAINSPRESNYRPELPEGALVPDLHPLSQLQEFKDESSDYWWSALYQGSPKVLGGNVFKEEYAQYYRLADLPTKFDTVVISWDCTFKDTDGTDFVVGQVWGKKGANVYLLNQVRARMSFTRTLQEVITLRNAWPQARKILIEDKANGPAVIDVLKKHVPGIIPVEPDGSKLARAHAVTSYWEARNVWLPDPDISPWVKDWLSEITIFDAGANDDQVDAFTQALRELFPLSGKLMVSQEAIDRALGLIS